MTSINTNNTDRAVSEFQKLPIEEQLVALGTLFKEVSGSVPSSALSTSSSNEISTLIDEIKSQRHDEQLQTLGDFLTNKVDHFDGVALDPHPSKALLELLPGSTQPPLARYEALDANSRIAFWYQLGQEFSSSIPTNAQVSPKATELLSSVRSLSAEEKAAFLGQLV
ncbi:orange carotenoid protein N-terminal domain-containing protein [Leptolyngbya sp. FACHB-17]|uniref:orange carotenoid protein N-terminal domain-containing protein n=1 Tax=unclassified Leptolyngbya TaxID=2650499 RepID=UPI001680667F|nr:orange carotenoid protein N-terminal domain-containing protein [Leptolyngbya sp. FACHB-17]MBD2081599.1 hypothetical protein [Leptolyngbya sp. FACHB-17]